MEEGEGAGSALEVSDPFGKCCGKKRLRFLPGDEVMQHSELKHLIRAISIDGERVKGL